MYILDSKGRGHYDAFFGSPLGRQNGNLSSAWEEGFPCEIKWGDSGEI